MKTLNDRVLEAKAIASLGKITQRDRRNRVQVVNVPGSDAAMYQVIIRRHTGTLTTECRKIVGRNGYVNCLGNKSGVCRHSLAAIFIALEDMGYTPRFRRNRQQAQQFANRNKEIALSDVEGNPIALVLQSTQGRQNVLYLVALDETAQELIKHTETKRSFSERVELMRGKVEEGID